MWHLLAGYIAVTLLQHLCSAFGVAVLYLLFLLLTSDIFALCVWIYLDRVYFRLLYYAVLLTLVIEYINIFHNALCT